MLGQPRWARQQKGQNPYRLTESHTASASSTVSSPPEGALTNIHLCASPEVAGMTSKYFDKCQPVASSPASYDVDVARRLWDVSAELTAAR